MTLWHVILLASAATLALKLAGHLVPAGFLERERPAREGVARRVAERPLERGAVGCRAAVARHAPAQHRVEAPLTQQRQRGMGVDAGETLDQGRRIVVARAR